MPALIIKPHIRQLVQGAAFLFLLMVAFSFQRAGRQLSRHDKRNDSCGCSLIVLGTVQDGGSPHIGCRKDCCRKLFLHPDPGRKVVSLGILDRQSRASYLLEATPDLPVQLKSLQRGLGPGAPETPDGIFPTHAHIGHYTGLMYLGREALNAAKVKVYVMPRMKAFLEQNGPWSQLVSLGNVALQPLSAGQPVALTARLKITPFLVPHRDEFSETVGYLIEGPHKKALFVPDIDKWEKWQTGIAAAIRQVDYAFVDGTFYDGAEIGYRDISGIPHPFIIETMDRLKDLPAAEKGKVFFIHFNHTNPALDTGSNAAGIILKKGFRLARMGQVLDL